METCVLLSLLLALGCVTINGAPVEHGGLEPGSCEDASTKAAAERALTMINQKRKEGYLLGLHRLSNAHIKKHGENGMVFYLTLDVVETNCSALSKKHWRSCDIRPDEFAKVYGQCKAVILIDVHGVCLPKVQCLLKRGGMRPRCGGCRVLIDHNDNKVQKAMSQSLEKFNKQSGLATRFALLQISHATSQVVAGRILRVEYTIQETTCPHSAEAVTAESCPLMDCEFAHKGFCRATHFQHFTGEENVDVECEIYEPEAAEKEKKFHLLGRETTQDQTQAADHNHNHLHEHEHYHDQHGPEHETVPDVPTISPEFGFLLSRKPNIQIPEELVVEAFPTSISAQCPTKEGKYPEVEELLANDSPSWVQ